MLKWITASRGSMGEADKWFSSNSWEMMCLKEARWRATIFACRVVYLEGVTGETIGGLENTCRKNTNA